MKIFASLFLVLILNAVSVSAPAQLMNVRSAVKNKVINKVNSNIDKEIDKTLNKAENAIIDSINKNNAAHAGEIAEADSVAVANGAKTVEEAMAIAGQDSPAALVTYSKYDFIPGEKVIFFDDFSQDQVGDFPALWNTNGSGEVVNTNLYPGKWFQFKGEGFYIPETKDDFPDNFTAEFDWVTMVNDEMPSVELGFFIVSGNMKDPSEGGAIPGVAGIKISLTDFTSYYSTYGNGEYILNGNKDFLLKKNTKYHMAFWVQKQRLRMYINEIKIFDIPRGMPEGVKYNILRFEMGGEAAPLIANFRVAAGLPDMRSKLLTEGKLVTYGIYFDVNSDKVKPESYGTLKGIATVLNENPGVKVKIFGYTDSDGNDAANLDLSKRRAASVKNELSKNFAIDASRMETDGKGEGQPVAPNDTPTNKALNRRVEFIKL